MIRSCKSCDYFRNEAKKYKEKYNVAKTGLSKEERDMLIELICQEQIKHIIPNNKHESNTYIAFEKLKAKIRIV